MKARVAKKILHSLMRCKLSEIIVSDGQALVLSYDKAMCAEDLQRLGLFLQSTLKVPVALMPNDIEARVISIV